uniref:Uncharacterized protein n=1 Tax=Calidris pygmaea TaxID=425635 RepID=A0A8C3PJE0_9CHAR
MPRHKMEAGRSQGRPRLQLVYVNSFGSHRCGSVIRYGRGCRQAEAGRAGPPLPQPSPTGETQGLRATPAPGDMAVPGPHAAGGRGQAVGSCGVVKKFNFIFQSKVWLKVWKVISKMLEENEKFRSRLLTCSQFNGEGKQ